MQFTFKNINEEYVKWRYEPIGEIQPKYWFALRNNTSRRAVVKRSHSQRVNGQPAKSKMYNHFGEFFGHKLAEKAQIESCPVELVTVKDTKNKYSKSKYLYAACASQSVLGLGEYMYSGEFLVSKFRSKNPERSEEILNTPDPKVANLSKGIITTNTADDNVDMVLATIAFETKAYEEGAGIRSPEAIKRDIDSNLRSAIEMIVYDCIFGNSDRHSQNWSMKYNTETGTVKMYPMYDNEAVLGLRKTEFEMKAAVNSGIDLSEYAKKHVFSRMGFAPMHSGVSYQNMLDHLVNKYPTYAIPAMKKITTLVSEKDVEELYEASKNITQRCNPNNQLPIGEELPEEFRIFGTSLYAERRAYCKKIIKEYEEKSLGEYGD